MDQLGAIIQSNDRGYSLMWSCNVWVSFVNSLIHLNETYQSWVIIGWGMLGIAWAFKELWVLGRSLVWYQNVTDFMSGIIRPSCWVCLKGDTIGILHDWPFVRITSRNTHGSPVSAGSRWLLFVPSSHLFYALASMISYFLKRTLKSSSLLWW